MPPPWDNYGYNSNTFGIPSHCKIYILRIDTSMLSRTHCAYLVYNIGKTQVHAIVKYGTDFMWYGYVNSAIVKPGEKKVIEVGIVPNSIMGLEVYNYFDTRAIVHCAKVNEPYPLYAPNEYAAFDKHLYQILKQVFALGVKYIPPSGSDSSGLLSAFWPEHGTSVWNQIYDQVRALLSPQVLQIISGILYNLQHYRETTSLLLQKIQNGVDKRELNIHYMNIAQNLIGFENQFIFGTNIYDYSAANAFVLPLYSAFILMKVSFYILGIRRQDEIGLSSDNVMFIRSYANSAIHGIGGANKYITELYKEREDHAYRTQRPEYLYDQMMMVRTYIATQGFEYIPIWNHMLENPTDETNPYNDVISYSSFHGRQTPNLIREAIRDILAEPLTPKLINGRRNQITYIEVYLWSIIDSEGALPKIGGMKIHFENEETYTMGSPSWKIKKIDFNNALLNKLEVYGVGAVDYLVFHFSDGRNLTCGTKESDLYYTEFELKGHHIVSLFLTTDNYSLLGQAANISVAYQLIQK